MTKLTVKEIVKAMGGTGAVSSHLNITTAAVSHWKRKNQIPPARLMYIMLIRPDLFVDKITRPRKPII